MTLGLIYIIPQSDMQMQIFFHLLLQTNRGLPDTRQPARVQIFSSFSVSTGLSLRIFPTA